MVTNKLGDHQGAVAAVTTMGDVIAPVDWYTWTGLVDRIGLRDVDTGGFLRPSAPPRLRACNAMHPLVTDGLNRPPRVRC